MRPPDLVEHDFRATRPNELWVTARSRCPDRSPGAGEDRSDRAHLGGQREATGCAEPRGGEP
jgi:hypothetical protein